MLEIKNLNKIYKSGFWNNHKTEAVKDVSFEIKDGEIFGLIGGSGCGKTTISRMIMGFLEADSGSICYDGIELTKLNKKEWKKMRDKIQMIFQIPQMTFNPRFTVYDCCAEPLRLFHLVQSKNEEKQMVEEMLKSIGVSADQMNKYPHEISGGQAQRISIIRTMILNPKLLICDEPTSMLDVSVQAQILNMILEKQKESNFSILFISHDLDVIRAVCDRVAVMESGKIIETGTVKQIFEDPKEPFTKHLISCSMSSKISNLA